MPFKGAGSFSVFTPIVSLKTFLTISILNEAVFCPGCRALSPFLRSVLCSSGRVSIMKFTPTSSNDIPNSMRAIRASISSKK